MTHLYYMHPAAISMPFTVNVCVLVRGQEPWAGKPAGPTGSWANGISYWKSSWECRVSKLLQEFCHKLLIFLPTSSFLWPVFKKTQGKKKWVWFSADLQSKTKSIIGSNGWYQEESCFNSWSVISSLLSISEGNRFKNDATALGSDIRPVGRERQ